eukprot:CAMPEP_0194349274 /NCGR_PEP_ID=MMETSP0171-20130528/106996_1 /TAXON_ID=218684 /ORGANISM="Corethron pennatum, Strain L29A3" /LENGTH=439 /DNA_ID=CAMNT_0039116705 /DNA_START=183 /DNA_END=1499 /DNA_ORIENTATION=-
MEPKNEKSFDDLAVEPDALQHCSIPQTSHGCGKKPVSLDKIPEQYSAEDTEIKADSTKLENLDEKEKETCDKPFDAFKQSEEKSVVDNMIDQKNSRDIKDATGALGGDVLDGQEDGNIVGTGDDGMSRQDSLEEVFRNVGTYTLSGQGKTSEQHSAESPEIKADSTKLENLDEKEKETCDKPFDAFKQSEEKSVVDNMIDQKNSRDIKDATGALGGDVLDGLEDGNSVGTGDDGMSREDSLEEMFRNFGTYILSGQGKTPEQHSAEGPEIKADSTKQENLDEKEKETYDKPFDAFKQLEETSVINNIINQKNSKDIKNEAGALDDDVLDGLEDGGSGETIEYVTSTQDSLEDMLQTFQTSTLSATIASEDSFENVGSGNENLSYDQISKELEEGLESIRKDIESTRKKHIPIQGWLNNLFVDETMLKKNKQALLYQKLE